MQGRLPEIPTTFLRGEAHELLQPLRFLSPGKMPLPAPLGRDRDALAGALAEANEEYGHPRFQQPLVLRTSGGFEKSACLQFLAGLRRPN